MVWAGIAAAAVLIAMVLVGRQRNRSRALLIGRLRTSGMYQGVAGLLRSVDSDLLEDLELRPQDIRVRMLDGRTCCYEYRAHQADPLSRQALDIMAQAVLVDLPRLEDERYYRRSVPARNAQSPVYAYTMHHARKDYLLRAMRG